MKPIRRPKLANRQAVLLPVLMLYFPVAGAGRVGVGVVVGGAGVEVEFVTGAAVVVLVA